VDAQLNVWTVSGGVISENGVVSTNTANVTLLLYYNGVIYQQATGGGWWSWTGTAWIVDSGDPRVAPTPTPPPAPAPSGTTVLSDMWAQYIPPTGPYAADNSTWNVPASGWTETITINNATFPNNTVIAWSFPANPDFAFPYSGPFVGWGRYASDGPMPAVIPPSQMIGSIQTLTTTYDISVGGRTDFFDSIYDFYLTSAPGPTSPVPGGYNYLHEIEIAVHLPIAYSRWLTGNGYATTPFTDGMGQQWAIVNNPGSRMVVFAPANYQDRLSATVDIKALLMAAVQAGYLSSSEYFSGLVLAPEPGGYAGTMTINEFSVNYN
jgi:hypothetical protein